MQPIVKNLILKIVQWFIFLPGIFLLCYASDFDANTGARRLDITGANWWCRSEKRNKTTV